MEFPGKQLHTYNIHVQQDRKTHRHIGGQTLECDVSFRAGGGGGGSFVAPSPRGLNEG